jgi:hypothetical protein
MLKLGLGIACIVGGTYATLLYSYNAIVGPLYPPSLVQFSQIAAVSAAACAACNFVGYRLLSSHFAK